MRLVVCVQSVGDAPPFSFPLQVGFGQQPLRWVGQVAKDLVRAHSPRGRRISAAGAGISSAMAVSKALCVGRIDSKETVGRRKPVDLDCLVSEEFRDGDEVYVKLIPADSTDREVYLAPPSSSPVKPVESTRDPPKLVAVRDTEFEIARDKVDLMIDGPRHLHRASITEDVDLDTFASEFSRLRVTRLMMPGSEALPKLREVLLRHYSAIRDIFRFFSNIVGSGACEKSAHSLSLNEFRMFLVDSGVTVQVHTSDIGVFVAACDGVRPRPAGIEIQRTDKQMGRHAFLDSLCLLSACMEANQKAEAAALGVGIATELVIRPTTVEWFLSTYLIPCARKIRSNVSLREQLREKDCAILLAKHACIVDELFLQCATKKPDQSDLTLSFKQFLQCLDSIGILQTSTRDQDRLRAEGVLTRKEAGMSFHLAQFEDGTAHDPTAAAPDVETYKRGLSCLDAREFVIALAHASCYKYEDPRQPLHEKLGKVFDMLGPIDIPPPPPMFVSLRSSDP